ncbi:MAG: hypothetical protein JXR34_10070, partial [Bacteroidales bacterium]|nr:hypothetical protein [Bacteroidales bacterium]
MKHLTFKKALLMLAFLFVGWSAMAQFSGGTGTSTDPYQIATLTDLQTLSTNSTYWAAGKYFIQTANIDASATSTWNGGAGFSPIGSGDYPNRFSGNYNGQNHLISGLYINSSNNFVGLFGYIDAGVTIANLGLTDVDVSGTSTSTYTYTGGFVGYYNGASLSNCYCKGNINGANGSNNHTGGFVGYGNGSPISNCYSVANVVAKGYVGGFIGYGYFGTYSNCFSTGKVVGSSANYSGGFVGNAYKGQYTACSSTSEVNGSTVGGFVGRAVETSNFTNCFSRGKVTGISYTGGFIGNTLGYSDVSRIQISNCCSSGEVLSPSGGGFLGFNTQYTTISNSYYDTEASGKSVSYYLNGDVTNSTINVAGLSTAQMKVQSNLSNLDFTNIWTIDATKNNGYPYLQGQPLEAFKIMPVITWATPANIIYGTALSATQLNASANVAGTFTYSPAIDSVLEVGDSQMLTCTFTPTDNQNYLSTGIDVYINVLPFTLFSGGDGTETNPYQISKLDDLRYLSEHSDYWAAGKYFIQTADIDASATSTWNGGAGFSPIGNFTTPFSGNYNGQNHTISGLYINNTSLQYVGLFGYIKSITTVNSISNLGLLNVDITTTSTYVDAGSLAGYAKGISDTEKMLITNCYATGSVSGYATNAGVANSYVGGLLGFSERIAVSYCHSTCTVYGSAINTKSSSTGRPESYVGGLIGYSHTNILDNCYSTGAVEGYAYKYFARTTSDCIAHVGGLIGLSVVEEISNCYSTANVKANAKYCRAGGLIGQSQVDKNIIHCYSVGAVSYILPTSPAGTGYKGGLIGYIYTASGYTTTISDCIWNTDTLSSPGYGTIYGSASVSIQGKTSAQMKSQTTYPYLDFDSTWAIDVTGVINNGYPYLLPPITVSPSQPMQLVFTTTAANQQVAIPLKGTVDVIIDWGDGSTPDTITAAGNASHIYATADTNTVSIEGTLTGLGTSSNLPNYKNYLTKVLSWGDVGLEDLSYAFNSCGG